MAVIKQKAGLLLRLGGTLALLWLDALVFQEFQARISQLSISSSLRFPRSFQLTLAVLALFTLLALAALWFPRWFRPLLALRQKLGWLNAAAALLAAAVPCWFFLYFQWGSVMNGPLVRAAFYGYFWAGMAWLLAYRGPRAFEWEALWAAGLLLGSVFALASALTVAVSYPFSLGWSEGNRLWDYSLRYGRALYLYPADQPLRAYIDAGRQSLWGLPFLLGPVSILGARLWGALVAILPYALLGWFLFRPAKNSSWVYFFLGLWSFLFLRQGPIYTPLVLAALLVAEARRRPLWLAVPLVVLAGYYVYMSRFTWLFAPAIWAAMLALGSGAAARQRWTRTLALAGAGLMGGVLMRGIILRLREFGAVKQASLVGLSATGLSQAVGRQPLLWDRLWPNSTFPLGIVLALVLAVLPALLIVLLYARRQAWKLDLWQRLALAGSLLAFLAVGLVASVKIGGGGDLHNLDMFLIGVLVLVVLAWEAGLGKWILAEQRPFGLNLLVLLAILIPASQGMTAGVPLGLPSAERAEQGLSAVRAQVAANQAHGDVLFIDNRQLLTFGFVPNVPLVDSYEKKLMMDEAMSNNDAYFAPFYRDLAAHRFSVIVTEPLQVRYEGLDYHFGNENDAWVRFVATPILCYYRVADTYDDLRVQLLVPRPEGQVSRADCGAMPIPQR